MKAAIIAAGEGSRLAAGGIATPKPLVPVAGEPLISRTIRAAAAAGASSIHCIVSERSPELVDYLETGPWPVPVERVVKTTPSSMESLFQLAPLVADDLFLLLTVDAVFPFPLLRRFVSTASAFDDADGVLALTEHVDDEKPLWAQLNTAGRIVALGDGARPSPYITAGFYLFRPSVFSLIEQSRNRGFSALRMFLGLLVERHFKIYGVPVAKTIDVDTPADLAAAEAYLEDLKIHA